MNKKNEKSNEIIKGKDKKEFNLNINKINNINNNILYKPDFQMNNKYYNMPKNSINNYNNLFLMMDSNFQGDNIINNSNNFRNTNQMNVNNNIINNINNNNIRTNVNNSYYYFNDNNIRNNSEINISYNDKMNNMNNLELNKLITLYNIINSTNNCEFTINNNNYFNNNNNINNDLLTKIIKNEILNDLKKKQTQEIQENILTPNNINFPSNICDVNFPFNNINNINNFNDNNNIDIFLQNKISNKNQLLNITQFNNKSNEELFQNLFLLNNNLNDLLNPISANSKNNCFNINSININNQIQLNPSSNNNIFNYNKRNNYKQSKIIQKKSINHHKKKYNNKKIVDPNKNKVNLMNILLCKDNRTTLMIKNIPNKYTISSFLDEINIYFKYTYDVFYLPIDYVNKCNLGFAFINFVEPLHIILFYELYRGKKWKKFKSDKICELLYAKFQNKKELIAHFEKGKVLLFDSKEKRPLILPTPKILPKINIPLSYLNLFIKLYPNVSYEIKDCKYFIDKNMNKICKEEDKNNNNNKANNNNNGNNDSNNNLLFVFSINGNFNIHTK